MSYPTIVKVVDTLGKDHDADVKDWRDSIVANVLKEEVSNDNFTVNQLNIYIIGWTGMSTFQQFQLYSV